MLPDLVEADPDLGGLLQDVVAAPAARQALHAHLRVAPGVLGGAARRLQLAAPAVELLAVLLAVEADPVTALLCGRGDGGAAAERPSLALLIGLFAEDAETVVEALAPRGPLAAAGLLQVEAHAVWSATRVGLTPPAVWRLLGVPGLDQDLPVGTWSVDAEAGPVPPGPLVLVTGGTPAGRAAAAAEAVEGLLLVAPVPQEVAQWAAVLREATLSGAAVLLELEDGRPTPLLREAVGQAPHLRWVLGAPAPLARAELPAGAVVPVRLPPEDPPGPRSSRAVAERRRPRRVLADLVLPERHARALAELVRDRRAHDRVVGQYGLAPRGSLVLLQGESGTGKTATAEALAGELQQDLLVANPAELVSKYIGETQKNFQRLFAQLEDEPAVLLVDEVDALLGKRTGISSSHDRYANLDTAYLLQRVERVQGLIVLTTNMRGNMDTAFSRRFDLVLDYQLPARAEREQLWQRMVPSRAPGREEVDGVQLAREFEVTGAVVEAAVRGACFAAAAAGSPLTTELLRKAVRVQMRKAGWLVGDTGSR